MPPEYPTAPSGDKDDQKFNEQAFLLDFFSETVAANIRGTSRSAASNPRLPWSYKTFLQITGDCSALMNRLQVCDDANVLRGLTNAQLGLLVPKVSIQKVIKRTIGKGVDTFNFQFDAYTDLQHIKDSSRKRGSDAGLISFAWTDMGTNPGESGLSFEATLKLKFQSFDGIFKKRHFDPEVRFADLLVPPGVTQGKHIEDISGVRREVDESDFQIRAVVGWNVPNDPTLSIFDSKDTIRRIANTQIALLLTLTSHDIDIKEDGSLDLTINYIASIEGRMMTPKLDILKTYDKEYDDALQGHRVSYNKLLDDKTDESAQMASKDRERRNLITKFKGLTPEQQKKGIMGPGGGAGAWYKSVAQINDGYSALNEYHQKGAKETAAALKVARLEMKTIKGRHKLKTYSRLTRALEGLVDVKGEDKWSSNARRIFFIELSQPQIELYAAMNLETFPDQPIKKRSGLIKAYRRDLKRKILAAGGMDKLDVKQTHVKEQHKVLTDIVSLLGEEEGSDDYAKNQAEKVDAFKQSLDSETDLTEGVGADRYYLNYFYFGDLVEAALTVLRDDPSTKQIESDYQLPGGVLGFMMGTIDLYGDGPNPVSVSLCDIPISLRVFQSWFLESIIKKGVTKLPLLSFLRSVCSKLITGVLNPNQVGSPAKAISTRLSVSSLLIRENMFQGVVGYLPSEGYAGGGRVGSERIPRKKRGKIDIPESWGSIALEKMRQYYFLYVGGNLNDSLKGVREKDEEIGIFHLFCGATKGLIKKINFKRTDIPFQREARILNVKEGLHAGGASSNLLYSDQYNASITMIGNAIFKPGMLVFINPTAMGLEPPATKVNLIRGSRSSQIGIGGYFLVTKVESIIEDGKFETNLELVAQTPMYALPSVQTSKKVAGNQVTTGPANPVRILEVSGERGSNITGEGEDRTWTVHSRHSKAPEDT